MPRLEDPIIIANGFSIIPPRYPFNQHTFAGANSFMLNLIKNNKVTLGIDAEDWKFDSSIAATMNLLLDSSLVFDLGFDSMSADTAFLHVDLQNKGGQKLPSGYPSRRMVVQLIVTDATGDTVFQSGTFDPDWRVIGESAGYEPHHDVIRQSDVPQIYEFVMGDVDNQFTSVLERAAVMLKDNRIPPQGFTTLSPVYDTVTISPDAFADGDFNRAGLTEGTGMDRLHYHVPLTGATGSIRVFAHVYYQSVAPKFLDEMFSYSSTEIDTFISMYNAADKTPVHMSTDSLAAIFLAVRNAPAKNNIVIFPTVTHDGRIHIQSEGSGILKAEAWTMDGKRVLFQQFEGRPAYHLEITLPAGKTVYLLRIETATGFINRKILWP
jgi:hypothetical protein